MDILPLSLPFNVSVDSLAISIIVCHSNAKSSRTLSSYQEINDTLKHFLIRPLWSWTNPELQRLNNCLWHSQCVVRHSEKKIIDSIAKLWELMKSCWVQKFFLAQKKQCSFMTQLLWIILIKDYYDKKEIEKLFSRTTGSHLNVDLWSQHFQGCYCTLVSYFQSH